uniref:cyclin-dependent kinase n=1 Tax=Chlamydomonas leiostraca TaxID=1034604 RepID=A0A7S0WV87_9CHLO|mmetsp:Transcript_30664/g.78319  ORF Transcript_30664/g.78319 Transcript_30664/m.78319 type:complete len:431 (+) Transcript_30664:84-1376(+)|eukprot:CAMPEP_0202859686 /NCGR_PEP_ID=MMETSP1391-20130828/1690_1 /ASSEMBLY_ACC=CAM_ASM_000867 /TAXON_ID=1034604 /ORGANISM="Chlamydomonas leiostraca, Strain SAG 11-49" /LENGTH=430 /DNA_ID=CAMNT_0049538741 /DNA_START=73 /DNA_END=1365 /DNA_ORIENTATION=+
MQQGAAGAMEASPTPVQALIDSVKSLRALAIEAQAADELLGALTSAAVARWPELASHLERFGWARSAEAGAPDGTGTWTSTVDLHGLTSCLQKFKYERLGQLGSGSYGVVYKARNRETNEVLAIKKLKHTSDESGLPDSTIREICVLRELRHENVVQLVDIISTINSSHVYLVMECLDCDLRYYLDTCTDASDLAVIKSIVFQILRAVHHSHTNLVLHRDLKPQNILVDKARGVVKVTDFGLARQYLPPHKAYSEKVITLYYRAPELLLGSPHYSSAIDLWSVGCIMAELANFDPLFRADSEIGLIHKIFETLGTPTEAMWPGVTTLEHYRPCFPQWPPKALAQVVPRLAADPQALHLLGRMLTYDPRVRITAAQALAHPWFWDLHCTPANTLAARMAAQAAHQQVQAHQQAAAMQGQEQGHQQPTAARA